MKIRNLFAASVLLASMPYMAFAQNDDASLPKGKKDATVVVPGGKINIGYSGGISLLPFLSNANVDVKTVWGEGETPWYTVSPRKSGTLKVQSDFWYKTQPRTAKLVFDLGNGKQKEVAVEQSGNESTDFFTGDIKIKVSRGNANQFQPGEGIEASYDGSLGSKYHSPWGSNTKFPVVLTYYFDKAPHIDYVNYIPRTDGQDNGHFGKISVAYTSETQKTFVDVQSKLDLGFSGNASRISLGKEGIDGVKAIRITVHTGKNNFASCAEMEFYQYNLSETAGFDQIFTDKLCSELKPGVTKADLDALSNPFARQLGYFLLSGDYDTKFRVGEFECYEDIYAVHNRLKTQFFYNRYENPTGIYFHANEKNIIFADGIDDAHPVNLIIKDFGGSGNCPESSYALKNGLNIVVPQNKGNSYVSYYSNDYKNAPNVRLHFALGRVCGYFDLERGDTNEDWVNLLKNTCSDMVDVRTRRNQVCFPTDMFRSLCPVDGVGMALNVDSTIYYERDVMGLSKYGIEPKNRQFARKIWTGGMYADGTGAAAQDPSSWMRSERSNFGFWGFGHELGHVNQINPGFKWAGCGETTNNVYSAWVEFKLGPGNYRLETEVTGIGIYSGIKGGRFNSYLEEGVRKGISWQLQCGPDYGGVPPTAKKTVEIQDYNGKFTGKDTTVVTGNYDHFIKLCPLWQLQLYCTQAGFSPDVYAKVFQDIRTHNYGNLTNGQQQLNFIRLVCDSTGLDFLPFFEKAGMFKKINAVIDDYGQPRDHWLRINDKMLDELRAHVKKMGYKKVEAEVNYITALNWKTYKDKAPLEGELNVGCQLTSHRNTPYVKVLHKNWKNTVAFETYDKDDNLLHISMHGLGGDNGNNYSMVMFPAGSAYIKAVGWDGTRMKCYEK